MLKGIPKWLLVPTCALALCGVFLVYIHESIKAIRSEQAEAAPESKAVEALTVPLATPMDNGAAEPQREDPTGWQPARVPAQTGAAAEAPSADEGNAAAQWRAVEQSQSYNNQLQYYSASNVSFEGGRVVITSREEFAGDKRYTSGLVESNDAYLYGRFSFVIRVSEGKGLFSAIWLLPVENKALPEIDVFEMIGSAPGEFYGVIHYMDGPNQSKDYFKANVEKKDTYLIELEWTDERLSWSIDGKCALVSRAFVPDEFMYLIVNQAVGGTWPGAPNADTAFPATFILESWAIEPEWSKPR